MSEVAHKRRRRAKAPDGTQQYQPTHALLRKQQNRDRRLARYQEVRSRIDGGLNPFAAARQTGVPLRTVQRWLAHGTFPERKHRLYPSTVDEHGPYLEKRYREGCRKINQLWQEVKRMGSGGQACTVRSWLR